MKKITLQVRVSRWLFTLPFALVLSAAAPDAIQAQIAQPPAAVANPPQTLPEEMDQEKLLTSYLRVREQLLLAQQTIVKNRAEAEASASAQAAAITERLEAIKTTLSNERQRQQAEALRAEAERERQQAATEEANRNMIWLASAVGGMGLLAMLFTSLFQWRAISRMTEVVALRPQLLAANPSALLPDAIASTSNQTVTLSNNRLMSSIERMERRMLEIEQTAGRTGTPATAGGADTPKRAAPPTAEAAKINGLLGKGQSLLRTDKPLEALACYNEILKLEINHPEALVRKGAALERLKQDAEAIQCYDRAIAADEKLTIAYLHKGGLCNRLERYEDALRCYERALRVEEEAKQVFA